MLNQGPLFPQTSALTSLAKEVLHVQSSLPLYEATPQCRYG